MLICLGRICHTQALTENCTVCLSQRKEVGFEAGGVESVDVLDVLPDDSKMNSSWIKNEYNY